MNEQEIADLFSEQVDRLLQGETPVTSTNDDALQELSNLAEQLAQIRYQANPAVQAAFQRQLDTWFASSITKTESRPEFGKGKTMSGKLFAVIISIFITIVTAVATIMIAILVVVKGVIPGGAPATHTPTPSETLTVTPPISSSVTATTTITTTAVPTGTEGINLTPSPGLPGTIDTIDVITIELTVEIRIDSLLPGQPHDGNDHDDDDDDDDDHNRGHGNDDDHDDDDNPGRDDD